jgi:hypothetical protein
MVEAVAPAATSLEATSAKSASEVRPSVEDDHVALRRSRGAEAAGGFTSADARSVRCRR